MADAASALERGAGPARGLPTTCTAVSASTSDCTQNARTALSGPRSAATWRQVPSASPPGGGLLLYDGAEAEVVYLFTAPGGAVETWSYANGSFRDLAPSASPDGIGYATYDSSDGYVVMFVSSNSQTNAPEAETWAFSSNNWSKLTPAFGPASTQAGYLADDPGDGYVLMWGPANASAFTNQSETWSFSAGTWHLLSPTLAPPYVNYAGFTYDSTAGEVLLFGGEAVISQTRLNSTWSYSGGAWANITTAHAPPPRYAATFTDDPSIGGALLFGGLGSNHPPEINDTWAFDATGWSEVSPAHSPQPRALAPATYDPADGYVFMYSGENVSGDYLKRDAWGFSSGNWTPIDPTPSRLARATLVYDPLLKAVVLFGGLGCPGVGLCVFGTLNETWEYSGGAWTQLRPATAPPVRNGAGMAFDATDAYVLLFGGGNTSTGAVLNDTWSFSGTNWTRIVTSPSPSPRLEPAMTYDSEDSVVLLFGGYAAASTVLSDTWEFSAGHWSHPAPTLSPVGRASAGMVDDRGDRGVLLFGGIGHSGGSYIALNDTWSFDAGNWTEELPVVSPSTRYSFAMSYDSSQQLVLLWGGVLQTGGVSGETWEYHAGVWRELSPPASPIAASGVAMTFDDRDAYSVMLGDGLNGLGQGAVWALEFTGLPRVNASAIPAIGVAPLTVSFSATIGGGLPPYQLVWSFGDGAHSSALHPSHQYAAPGTYNATLGVVDALGVSNRSNLSIEVFGLPMLAPTATPSAAVVPATIDFVAGATSGDLPYRYAWSFGDGTSSNASSPSHTYVLPGRLTVNLTVTDGQGSQATASVLVTLVLPLSARLTVSPVLGASPLEVHCGALLTGGFPPYGSTWNFGDGSPPATGLSPVHAYSAPGTFDVQLVVKDATGNATRANQTVVVFAPLAVAIASSTVRGTAPLSVEFTALPTGGLLPYQYTWSFGDAGSSQSPTASTTFSTAGTYAVRLNVTDGAGEVGTANRTIVVEPAPPVSNSNGSHGASGAVLTMAALAGLAVLAIVVAIASGSWWRRRRRTDAGHGTASSERELPTGGRDTDPAMDHHDGQSEGERPGPEE
ncbi:MAG: PKD domain-containing protein [Thermoplasmata archaeon]|nr:PKD domain-containing protein [Thermoplasmata archaeon]